MSKCLLDKSKNILQLW